jgi:hypothetical protein
MLLRGRFKFQLQPGQSPKKLAKLQTLIEQVFRQPAVANWQQYLGAAGSSDASAEAAAGPTQLEQAGFSGVNDRGALVFDVVFVTPHPSWGAFVRTRHVALLACVAALEGEGVKLAHFAPTTVG